MATDPGNHQGAGIQVVDNSQHQRYEIVRDGQTLGFAAHQRAGRLIVFTHTEVEPHLEGQGIGGQLVRGALDHVRAQGIPVLALCPFVRQWMQHHPQYADLDYRPPGQPGIGRSTIPWWWHLRVRPSDSNRRSAAEPDHWSHPRSATLPFPTEATTGPGAWLGSAQSALGAPSSGEGTFAPV